LDRLLAGAEPGEFEVVVVCNGCTDGSADVARSVDYPVSVIETPIASKIAALNLGDQAATAFPRLYLDADVVLDRKGAHRLAASLDDTVEAAAPGLSLDETRSSWAVRSYLRLWSELPAVRLGLAGRGAFVLSEAGRGRFGAFPDVLADDFYIDRLYGNDERRIVDGVTSTVTAPRTLADLLARKTRVFVGNRQLAEDATLGPHPSRARPGSDRTAWIGVVLRSPKLLVDVPAYLYVSLVAKRRARRRLARGAYSWDRDESARNDGIVSNA
jgi:glycosyltransferase involved in cell wall biosynthesis